MSLIHFVFALAAAWSTTFVGVPKECQRHLLSKGDLAAVVDWTPWDLHLAALGIEPSAAAALMRGDAGERGYNPFLKDLTWWASRKHPTGASGVTTLLNLRVGTDSFRRDARFLLKRVPLWLDRDDEDGLAKRFLSILDDRDFTRALLAMNAWLRPEARSELRTTFFNLVEKRLRDQFTAVDRLLLHVVSSIPWREIPEVFRSYVEDHFVDLEVDAPLRSDAIRTIGFRLCEAGNCRHMSNGHFRLTGVIPNDERRRPQRYVRVGGTLVGMLKDEPYGEPSMIALRNVMDGAGRLVLALGAVYELRAELVAADTGSIIDVPTLDVGPIDFALNQNAWDVETVSEFLTKDEMPSTRIIDGKYRQTFSWDEVRRAQHRRIQAEVLRRLRLFRSEREATLHVDRVKGAPGRPSP